MRPAPRPPAARPASGTVSSGAAGLVLQPYLCNGWSASPASVVTLLGAILMPAPPGGPVQHMFDALARMPEHPRKQPAQFRHAQFDAS